MKIFNEMKIKYLKAEITILGKIVSTVIEHDKKRTESIKEELSKFM